MIGVPIPLFDFRDIAVVIEYLNETLGEGRSYRKIKIGDKKAPWYFDLAVTSSFYFNTKEDAMLCKLKLVTNGR